MVRGIYLVRVNEGICNTQNKKDLDDKKKMF